MVLTRYNVMFLFGTFLQMKTKKLENNNIFGTTEHFPTRLTFQSVLKSEFTWWQIEKTFKQLAYRNCNSGTRLRSPQ